VKSSPHHEEPIGAHKAAHSAAVDVDVQGTKATHSIVFADGEAPAWVQLIPAGVFEGIDGRGPYDAKNPKAIAALSEQKAGDFGICVGYGHAIETDDSAEAAGWCKELEVRSDGIWGKVDWTAQAAEKIKGRQYRGLSPVFYHDANGVVLWIARAGLTNKPNLRIKSLNAREGEVDVSEKEKAILGRIMKAFGLPESSDEETLLARCSAAIEAEGALVKVAGELKLEKKATTDDVIAAVQSAQSAKMVDPTKYVPMEQYNALSDRLVKAQQSQSDAAVDAAIVAGKITPANREWAKSLHSTDPKAFAEFVKNAPVFLVPGAEDRKTDKDGKPQLTDGQKAICSQLDIDPKKFAKTIQQETK
jgi:phage I-like protein